MMGNLFSLLISIAALYKSDSMGEKNDADVHKELDLNHSFASSCAVLDKWDNLNKPFHEG